MFICDQLDINEMREGEREREREREREIVSRNEEQDNFSKNEKYFQQRKFERKKKSLSPL